MPFSILIISHRLPHLSPAAFKSHYETKHIPLLQSIAGATFPISHTRQYIQRTPSATTDKSMTNDTGGQSTTPQEAFPATALVGSPTDFDFDCLSTLEFASDEDFQRFFQVVSQDEAAVRIADDEKNFLDRGKMRVVILGERMVSLVGSE